MEEQKVSKSFIAVQEKAISQPLPILEAHDIPRPALPGVIYGEIVFWVMVVSLIISIPGFIFYLGAGGYLDSGNVLSHLWRGSDCLTIWKEVGNLNHPLPWYASVALLPKGDMLAMLGISLTGVAGVIGMWGAFAGTLRKKEGIYIVFALIIAVVLTLSALGLIKLH
jgi:hypothetical protein